MVDPSRISPAGGVSASAMKEWMDANGLKLADIVMLPPEVTKVGAWWGLTPKQIDALLEASDVEFNGIKTAVSWGVGVKEDDMILLKKELLPLRERRKKAGPPTPLGVKKMMDGGGYDIKPGTTLSLSEAEEMLRRLKEGMVSYKELVPGYVCEYVPYPDEHKKEPQKMSEKKASPGKPPREWYQVVDALQEKNALPSRILKYGPPGTGKSSWGVRKLGALRTPPLTPNMGKEELIGTFILDRGNTVWVDGPVTLAMRTGRCVIIDEIDKAGPEIIAVLHGILDDPEIAEIVLPMIDPETKEPVRVRPKEGFRVIATTNEAPSFIQPESLQDRFEMVLLCDKPHPDALLSLGEGARKMLGRYYEGRAKLEVWKPEISMRRMLAWNRMSAALGDPDWAADLVFGAAGKEVMSCLGSTSL